MKIMRCLRISLVYRITVIQLLWMTEPTGYATWLPRLNPEGMTAMTMISCYGARALISHIFMKSLNMYQWGRTASQDKDKSFALTSVKFAISYGVQLIFLVMKQVQACIMACHSCYGIL